MNKLYSWYFWYNHHEDLWYAIPRDKVTDFHNGKLESPLNSKNINHLIDYINKL